MSADYDPRSMDSILTRMEDRQIHNTSKLDAIMKAIDEHDTRITELESIKWKVIGFATAASAGGAAAMSKIFGG